MREACCVFFVKVAKIVGGESRREAVRFGKDNVESDHGRAGISQPRDDFCDAAA